MRNGSDIFDHVHFEPSCLQRTNRGFAPRSGSLDINFHLLHSMIHRCLGGGFRCHLRGERRAFARAFKALDTSARPGKGIAAGIRNRYQCVIKGGTNMCHTGFNIFPFPLLRPDNFFGSQSSIPPSYALLRFAPTVLRGPLRVRALVFVRCPRTGRP